MDQAPTAAQAPTSAHTPTETAALHSDLRPPVPQTPLGEPMDRASVLALAVDPLEWHLQYWLAISVIGILRREDPLLMVQRIEFERAKIADQDLRTKLSRVWDQYWAENYGEFVRYFTRDAEPTEEIKRHFRDIDRMLEDKGRKTRESLARADTLMITLLRDARIEEARVWFEKLGELYQKLAEEERKDAEAGDRQSEGEHNQEGEVSDISDAEHGSGYENMSGEDESDEDESEVGN